jgi:flagellar motor protein MotB
MKNEAGEVHMMMNTRAGKYCSSYRWWILSAALLALIMAPGAAGQQAAKPPSGGDELPDKVELNAFGGGSFFQGVQSGLGTKLVNGGAFGFRVTENIWRYVGLEQAFTYSTNNVRFESPAAPGLPQNDFGHRIYQYSLNPVFYWTERGSKIRPFLTVGLSALYMAPTDSAKGWARSPLNANLYAQNLDSNINPAMNYGGGLKWHLTERWGLRFDARGLWTKNPTFRLADYPNGGLYIPRGDKLHGIQTTAGISYYFGRKAVAPTPPPPPPGPLPGLNAGTLSVGPGTLCQGRAITVRNTGASDPAGRALTYKWRVNGQPMGGNSPELSFTPDRAGDYKIELSVEAENNPNHPVRVASAPPLSLNVQPYNPPTVSNVMANPATLQYGQTATLSAQGTGSACSTISFQWTVTEGTLSNPKAATTSFDSKAVKFEQGGKIQSKTITATVRVTDDRGASATGTASIKVDFVPTSIRYSDVIFSKNSDRVNNCGKRILLEEVAPKAADPDYEVVLVGHIDQDEVSKTKKPSDLDMRRVLNAYAVLTAGGGTCANVDKSRIKVTWVGTEQVSDMQPGLCGTAARSASKERAGQMVSTADQNRRVEVWLVPKGTKMPAAFKEAKQLDEKLLKKLGCPK